MSLLNGNISNELIHTEPMPFGTCLRELFHIDCNCMDCAAFVDDILVCGGKDSISLYRIADNGEPEYISSLCGLGETRQMAVSGKFVYVSTRADGVFICDLSDVSRPVIAYHIDTLELATGIDASGGLLAVTNRHLGCELFDVRNPYFPVRLGDFLCGEAQSVKLYRNCAFIGDWINRQVRIFDISDVRCFRELSRFAIDGFADGICIAEIDGRTVCIAGGGHHSARLKNRRKYQNYTYFTPEMIADGFGCGHGIEIFDVTNPKFPEYIAHLKTPPLFGGPDTWRVFTDGKKCVFTDSMNGLFVIDISNPFAPSFVSHFKLPPKTPPVSAHMSIQTYSGSVTGAASVNGYLCAASPSDGVLVFDAGVESFDVGGINDVPFTAFDSADCSLDNDSFYRSKGQLHSFCELNGYIFCACGDHGIDVIDSSGKLIYNHKTNGICHDICVFDGKIIAAEGQSGAACYLVDGCGLRECDRVLFGIGKSVREVVAVGGCIVLELGSGFAVKLMLDENNKFVSCGDPVKVGLLYHRHISRSTAGKYLPVFTISPGPMLLDISDKPKLIKGTHSAACCPINDGVCGYGDKLIAVIHGQYLCMNDPLECINPLNGKSASVDGALLCGVPFVCGNMLLLLDRCGGTVEVIDISDPHLPRFVKRVETSSHPEFAAIVNGKIMIACGYGGIIAIDC
nr:hypothetical protein [Clostridia bacterium]